jgi:hypothetical protein
MCERPHMAGPTRRSQEPIRVPPGVNASFAESLSSHALDSQGGCLVTFSSHPSSQGEDAKNWRFRRILAKQLNGLALLYDSADTDAFVVPLALTLASDVISFVRQPAYEAVSIASQALLPENQDCCHHVQVH